MTGEAWSEVARAVMKEHPSAWIFFVTFILICTFVVLNLFIAMVVRAMEDDHTQQLEETAGAGGEFGQDVNAVVLAELTALRADIQALRAGYEPGSAGRVREVDDLGP